MGVQVEVQVEVEVEVKRTLSTVEVRKSMNVPWATPPPWPPDIWRQAGKVRTGEDRW